MKRIPKQEYTAEFKEQAVRRAAEVGSIARTAEELGLVEQTLRNWVKAAKAGKLNPAGAKQITAEQMELSRLRAQVARLEMENEILKKSDGIFRKGAAVKYAWIEKQRRTFPLPVLCEALSVSQSGFRAWQTGGAPNRKRLTDAQALMLIRTIHQEVRQAYGARRIHAELRGRGWSIKPRMTTDLVLDALSMAWFRRRPQPGVLFHSDRGSQYASHAYQARLAKYGMRGSMSRKGNCWDNAPTESFFNSLKNERVHGVRYATRNEATSDLFQYIAVFYNRSRRHSTLGYLSPTTFLQNWIERQNQQEMAA